LVGPHLEHNDGRLRGRDAVPLSKCSNTSSDLRSLSYHLILSLGMARRMSPWSRGFQFLPLSFLFLHHHIAGSSLLRLKKAPLTDETTSLLRGVTLSINSPYSVYPPTFDSVFLALKRSDASGYGTWLGRLADRATDPQGSNLSARVTLRTLVRFDPGLAPSCCLGLVL
jgi:hypothetical protein